jgi:hypothetical protein
LALRYGEAMDGQSQRVANELVEAGLERLAPVDSASLESLNVAFLALGDGLASAEIASFARGLESVQADTPEATSLREKVAVDFHRDAAAIVAAGARVAVISFLLGGKSETEARAAASWQLRSAIAEDTVPGESGDELIATAHRNYVLAAADLYRLNTEAELSEVEGFASSVLHNVVSFAVASAAVARSVENPVA